MNEKFRRRLIGLIALIAVLFAFTWLLPREPATGIIAPPSTTVPLDGTIEPSAPPAASPPSPEPAAAEAGSDAATSPAATPAAAPSPEDKPASPRPQPATDAENAGAEPKSAAANAPAPSPATAAPVLAAKPPVPASGAWYVQVGSYTERSNAQTTLSLLGKSGYHGDIAPIKTAAGTLQRVRVGPFASDAVARAELVKIAHQGYPDSRVVGPPKPKS